MFRKSTTRIVWFGYDNQDFLNFKQTTSQKNPRLSQCPWYFISATNLGDGDEFTSTKKELMTLIQKALLLREHHHHLASTLMIMDQKTSHWWLEKHQEQPSDHHVSPQCERFFLYIQVPSSNEAVLKLCDQHMIDGFLLTTESSSLWCWSLTQALERISLKDSLRESRYWLDYFQHLSMCDELTGLSNMRNFNSRLWQDYEHSEKSRSAIAIIMLDIDMFKTVNDKVSHMAGSKILAQIGCIIKQNIRRSDLAARYGGDEFVIMLNQTGYQEAKKVTERLMLAIAQEEFVLENHKIQISVSCGIAIKNFAQPQASQTKQSSTHSNLLPHPIINDHIGLLHKADEWLYLAKSKGKACYVLLGERFLPNGQMIPLTKVYC
ncbi:MAG: GGDEF domain-containing protein [Proteobacteria bacterium]|nr:GGDEF domain-containing protein [Pseudomonadota bacterium]